MTAAVLVALVLALVVGAIIRHLVRAVRLWDSQATYGVPCLKCGDVEVHIDGACVQRERVA